MTAEIAILNPHGIALAADSAVTVSFGGNRKIYNSANKLFTLSKYAPVGVMIYGNAEFRGIPWEILIKKYRHELRAKKYQHLKQYSEDFCKFIDANNALFSDGEPVFYRRLRATYIGIRDCIAAGVKDYLEKNKTIDEAETIKIAQKCVGLKAKEIFERNPLPGSKPKRFTEDFQKVAPKVADIVTQVFEKQPLSQASKDELIEIAKVAFWFRAGGSGLIIAGYGEKELFPSCVQIKADNFLTNSLESGEETLLNHGKGAAIIPLAQRDVVDTFLAGIAPDLRSALDTYMHGVFDELPSHIAKGLPDGVQEKDKSEFIEKVKVGLTAVLKTFKNRLGEHIQGQSQPVMTVVGSLPKDELAAMAEALVNLTSFRRRVSTDAETVGGPVDVAVISKWDGFVWIKRKHYFRPELNPNFLANYFNCREDKNETEE